MDVIISFLNGNINEEVLMEIPTGFLGARDTSKVCRINKALYGLKQSQKVWYIHINLWFKNQGVMRSNIDPNLYYLKKDGKITILLLYVDDLLITGDCHEEIFNP